VLFESIRVLPPLVIFPPFMVRILLTVKPAVNETPFELFIVRLFRFVTLEGIETPAELPPSIRLEAADVIRFDGVPAIVGPFKVRVFAPTVKVPDESVRVPPTVTLPHIVTALPIVRLFSVIAGRSAVPEPPIVMFEVAPPTRVPQFI
jgi:hypothetical protein